MTQHELCLEPFFRFHGFFSLILVLAFSHIFVFAFVWPFFSETFLFFPLEVDLGMEVEKLDFKS